MIFSGYALISGLQCRDGADGIEGGQLLELGGWSGLGRWLEQP